MHFRTSAFARHLAGGAALCALLPAAALAQAAKPDTTTLGEVVVTGTLIRGIAPAGSQVIGVSAAQVEAVGGNSTNQILNSIPQVTNFFAQPIVGISGVSGANGSNPIARPNLRSLPAANTSGGAQTLVLIDGHRVVGAGTQQVAVDPDIIAPGVIQRVEALTDGGSAVYGSDALGGVLNFITKRNFDGLELTARAGFADAYRTYAGSLVAGKNWNGGGAYMAYGYKWNDAIFGADRDFVKRIDWNTGIPTGRNCTAPTVSIGAASYVLSGSSLVRGGPNTCDSSDDSAIYPEVRQHNVFGHITQDLTDKLTFDMTGLYARRETIGQGGTLGLASSAGAGGTLGTVTITSANPQYRSTGDANGTAAQTVRFNYGPVAGARSATQDTLLETWNIAPQLTYDITKDWQARLTVDYGRADVHYSNNVLSAAAQSAALAAGKLNPYDIAASDPTALAAILGGRDRGDGKNELLDSRLIFDGPAVHLPGGDLHVAAGAEFMQDNFKRRQANAALVLSPFASYKQSVWSVFGEAAIPIIGAENALSFVREFTIDVSGRYDRYNDFGGTFNPKVGVTYKPVDWVNLRGNWGKSFNAPSPSDQLGPLTSSAGLIPGAFLQPPPGKTFTANETGIFLGGGSVTGLQPQTAKNWSVGFDVTPPVVPGLKVSASYYAIDLNGTIGRPVTGVNLTPFYNGFPNLWIFRPSGQQVAQVLGGLANQSNIGFTLLNPTSTSQALVSSGGSGPQPIGVILDTLVRNLGHSDIAGLDFSVTYRHDTDFGGIDGSFAGNYRIKQDTRISPTSPVVDDLATETNRFLFAATAGVDYGAFRAQVTWNHLSGYLRGDAGSPGAFGQTNVDAYNVVNLFFKYDVPQVKDLQLTLNVDNVFNVDPPLYKNSGQPGYDPSHVLTLGRFVQFGIDKKF